MPPTPMIPAAVQWHEGMLLAPQHFQQQDQHHEALLHFHLQRAVPFHWGVSRLEYDRTRLVAGTFQLREVEALLPDGLFLSYQAGEGAPPLQLTLTGLTEVNWQHPVRLHVGVPTGRTANPSRFVSTTSEPLADESTGDMPLSISQLTPRLELFAGSP